ncbi:MAG: hypothetical protein AUJ49_13050 [Desulfovibrionaceae bacterium CG1_02_65_16]|nr:MAG: hypothetical protein AUJ49_13050 [Desulfovibrionaceae bacterium CG1_02_65_16]
MLRKLPHTWTDRALFAQSLRRMLLKRLLGLTLVVCVLTAVGFYVMERARFTASLRDGVLYASERFERLAAAELNAPGLGDHAQLQRIVDTFQIFSQPRHLGVSARISVMDAQGVEAAVNRNPDFDNRELDRWLADHRYALPESQAGDSVEPRYELAVIGARPYLHMLIPLRNSRGVAVAYAESLFAVREAVIRDAQLRMWITLSLAVSLVLATSGLLYPVLLRLLRRMYAASVELMEANLETLSVLGRASAKRDSDTDEHSHRVTLYAVRLGEALRLAPAVMRALIKGAFLHDVGKIGVRDAVLRKPGPLTPEEMAEMRLHVSHGRDIVSHARWLADAAEVIGRHHERYDGGGYDGGLKGEAIPLTARVFAVADVFDALTSARPYKQALPVARALEMMASERGSHFDPAVLDTFIPLAPELFAQCAGRGADEMDAWLRENCARYFSTDAEQWLQTLDLVAPGS